MTVRFSRIRQLIKKHNVLVLILLMLTAVALVSRTMLYGQGSPPGAGASDPVDSNRSCSSRGSPFESLTKMKDLQDEFTSLASQIVDERIGILNDPTQWSCATSDADRADPPMPKLVTVASKLPGWAYEYDSPLGLGTTTVKKPVTFENFSSIFLELQREYECRLLELEDRAPQVVRGEPDIKTFSDLGRDMAIYAGAAADERIKSRIAVERTIEMLRPFELRYPVARELTCYALASLDLRSELSLLADAMSCMPKIWDAVTSLHDRYVPPSE